MVIAGSGTSVTTEIFGFNFHDLIPRAENPSDFDAVGLEPGTLTDPSKHLSKFSDSVLSPVPVLEMYVYYNHCIRILGDYRFSADTNI